ncbi:UDP-glucose:glycoprotein glucosyltransferase [Phytophthora nicotianae]|nr:UDP-glucose:glycoprotein glucosyltransferase [Phytophthora nicotianae]
MPNQPDANGANAITIKGTDFGCFPNDAITISFASTDTVQPISRKLGAASSMSDLETAFHGESYRQLAETTTPADATNTSSNSTGTIVWNSSSELIWYPPKTKAGITSITLSVGGNVMSASSQTQLKFQCSPGYYRTSTEFCDECPEGATCAGGDEMPLAKPGYWREGEVVFACDPMYACLGANRCAVGYMDIRCGECEKNYHKLNAECNLCPDNKWGSVAIVVICLGVASIVSYLLTRKGVSLGLLSIGIDYFQTLSIFGNARISWPASLINLFSTLSAFNLNLELIAPECFAFQVSFVNKWFIIELFPLVVAATSLGIFAALYAYKRFIKRRRTRLTSHLPQLFGSTLVMMYYLFLYLTRTTLDVFNCVGTIPSDGKLYMVAIYTQCFKPGGIHMQLFPFAVLAFVVYSLGYPLFVLLTLSRNRALVMEDQLLRAMQRGTSRRTNPNCWVFRKKFSKLYYQFKPDYWYWMVLIILRKFLLAGIGLLFRQDPVFQLATATFVLFVNYALQVRCRPYMSAYETQRVLADYAKRVLLETRRAKAKGEAFIQPAHLRLEMHASTVTAWKSGHGDHGGSGVAGSAASPGIRGANEAILASQEPQNLVGYLWDHNTVEACLLFSASLVLLAGVMFESGRLGSSETGFTSASAQMLAIATTMLVVVSCVYFALVLITELVVALRPDYYKRITRVQKVFSSPRRHLKDDTETDHSKHRPAGDDDSDNDDDDELEMVATMTQNPLHFNRALAGARGRAMRARERDALAALQDIQRRGSNPRRNSPQHQSERGVLSDEENVSRRRRSQRRRGTKRDENLMAELTSAIEETDDVNKQRRGADD